MTDLYATLRNNGRLHGGILGSEYEPADPVARRFHGALVRLALALMNADDPALYVHRVSLSVAVARRLGLGRYSSQLDRDMNTLLDECNQTRLSALRAALALAETEIPVADRERRVQSIVIDAIYRLSALADRARALHLKLEPSIPSGQERRSLLSSRATRGLMMVSLGAALACDSPPENMGQAGSGGASASTSSHAGGSTSVGGGNSADAAVTVQTDLPRCDPNNIAGGTWTASGATAVNCPATTACDVDRAIGLISSDCRSSDRYSLYMGANGEVTDVTVNSGGTIDPTLKQCILDALVNERFPCLSEHSVWVPTPIIIY